MKVLVTGSKGFIGKNLVTRLKENENVEIIEFDVDNTIEELEQHISTIDFIFHLAGINRPKNNDEFYKGNTDLTSNIINLINKLELDIPILLTSSIQATKDNDYGKSKKMAEDILLEYGKTHKIYPYRLHNVFGKWCRPNYNSVIATFCHNIANDLDISVNDEKTELELIYIDDIIEEFVSVCLGEKHPIAENEYYYISPVYKKELGYIANLIKSFKNDMESLDVPETGDDFIKKIFSTFVSYVDISKMSVSTKMNLDERGSFTELVHTKNSGQFSVSTSHSGIIRGNHYHHTKIERFIVIKGKARISFRKIDEENVFVYEVTEENIEIITIPPGYTHKIENIGDKEMILFIWCNEIFDKNKTDTYYCEV